MKTIQITQFTPDQLREMIKDSLKEQLELYATKITTKDQEEYLTQNEVVNIFKISKATLISWVKQNKIPEYGIGARRLYKRSEIDKSLIKTK